MWSDRKLNYGREQVVELARFPGRNYQRILDVGVGKGFDLINLHKEFQNAELFGVDSCDKKISFLEHKEIAVYKCNVETQRLPFDDESFDLVLSNQTLEHVKNVHHCISEMLRVTNVDGYLIIGTPNLGSLHNRVRLLFNLQPSVIRADSGHVRGFVRSELSGLIGKLSGNTVSEIGYRGSNFYPFPSTIARTLAAVLPSFAVSSFVLFKKLQPYRDDYIQFLRSNPFETDYFFG